MIDTTIDTRGETRNETGAGTPIEAMGKTKRGSRWPTLAVVLVAYGLLAIVLAGCNDAPQPADSRPEPDGKAERLAGLALDPGGRAVLGEWLYFRADDGVHGKELWRTDGGDPELVADIRTGPDDGFPDELTVGGEWLYFRADDGVHGRELWRTNGVATEMVADILPGAAHSYPQYLTPLGDTLIFAARDLPHGRELWRTDGTTAGTALLKDIRVAAGGEAWPGRFATIGEALVFSASDGVHGTELWRTDGTTAGTVLLKDIQPGSNGSTSQHFLSTAVDDGLVFWADDGVHGRELWRTDGTPEGTALLVEVLPGSAGSRPGVGDPVTRLGDQLFFKFGDRGLWRFDGVAAQQVTDQEIDPTLRVRFLRAFRGWVYFSSSDGVHGRELWRTNGTVTEMIADIHPGPGDAYPQYLTPLGNALYFTADDGTRGRELWRTDGTEEGTRLVADITEGSAGSDPKIFAAFDGSLYLNVASELWKFTP